MLTQRPKHGAVTVYALAFFAAFAAAPSAQAQINPFRNYSGPVLAKADIAAGREAAARLLANPSPEVGAEETWKGPASGNSGTLTIERIYQQRGHDCRAVRSTVLYRQGTQRSFQLHTCQIAGQWKLTH